MTTGQMTPEKMTQLFALTGDLTQTEIKIDENKKELRDLYQQLREAYMDPANLDKIAYTTDQVFNGMCKRIERGPTDRAYGSGNWSIGELLFKFTESSAVFHFDLDAFLRASAWQALNPVSEAPFIPPAIPFDPVVIILPTNATLIALPRITDEREDIERWKRGDRWTCECASYLQTPKGWLFSVYSANYTILDQAVSSVPVFTTDDPWLAISNDVNGDAEWYGKGSQFSLDDTDYQRKVLDIISGMAQAALNSCRYIDCPKHHLVVEEPRSWKPGQTHAKIHRAADRPRVRLVAPEEVQRIYPHHREDTGRTVTPHARRGHTKLLRSPRFKTAQGRRVVIRPTWVGSSEWEHQSIRYRVVTTQHSKQTAPRQPVEGM